MLKVAIVSSIRPETNYSTYLIEALQKNYSDEAEVYAYCENESENREITLANKKYCWDRNWHYFFQVLRQAQKDKIDILHFQHEINMYGGPRTAALFPFLILAARVSGFKTVVTTHAVLSRKQLNRDLLETFEWPYPFFLTPLVKIIFPVIYILIGFFAQKLIVHSPGLKQVLISDYFCPASKIKVVPHGVPEEVGYQLSAVDGKLSSKLEGKKFLLYFGYLHRRKGLEILLKAFKDVSPRYPEIFLVLAGGEILPGYARELRELVVELKLESRVLFTGFLNLTDLRYLLDHCQFVVLPAIYSIAASGPLAQVFAHEKAVIVSDLGVFREEIQPGINGLLAKVRDSDDLARQMERLLVDEPLKGKIVENVRRVKSERAWLKVAAQTLLVYRSL